MTERGDKLSTESWVDRVRAADEAAEEAFARIGAGWLGSGMTRDAALIAIAAELRAARIAQRPSK